MRRFRLHFPEEKKKAFNAEDLLFNRPLSVIVRGRSPGNAHHKEVETVHLFVGQHVKEQRAVYISQWFGNIVCTHS